MTTLLGRTKVKESIILCLWIYGITFNEKILRVGARRQAAAKAREIANTIATSLGVELGNVYSISENSYIPGSIPQAVPVFPGAGGVAMGFAADSASVGPSIAGGEIVITSSVSVSFEVL